LLFCRISETVTWKQQSLIRYASIQFSAGNNRHYHDPGMHRVRR
jgi:hypothetical protein